jgi:hypothetical protein
MAGISEGHYQLDKHSRLTKFRNMEWIELRLISFPIFA